MTSWLEKAEYRKRRLPRSSDAAAGACKGVPSESGLPSGSADHFLSGLASRSRFQRAASRRRGTGRTRAEGLFPREKASTRPNRYTARRRTRSGRRGSISVRPRQVHFHGRHWPAWPPEHTDPFGNTRASTVAKRSTCQGSRVRNGTEGREVFNCPSLLVCVVSRSRRSNWAKERGETADEVWLSISGGMKIGVLQRHTLRARSLEANILTLKVLLFSSLWRI